MIANLSLRPNLYHPNPTPTMVTHSTPHIHLRGEGSLGSCHEVVFSPTVSTKGWQKTPPGKDAQAHFASDFQV